MSFDIKQWIQTAPAFEDFEVDFRDAKIPCRVLRGAAWEKYAKAQSDTKESALMVALLYGLIDPKTGGQFEEEEIEQFYNAYTYEGIQIARTIIDRSSVIVNQELERFKQAEKNSETPGTVEQNIDSAGSSE